jgi:hypothetical protein
VKHRWRTDLNWLCGATASRWVGLLKSNRVDPAYWHRAALVSVLSLYNSALQRYDAWRSGTDFSGVAVRRPLFVLGHWRSGTTWLFHMLAQDPRRAAPNAFQTVNPTTFLSTEAFSSRVFGFLVPDKRVQDDLPLGFHLPEEDEYAIGLLCGCTPYLGRSFPDRLAHYERYLTLHDCTAEEVEAFGTALREFAARLTVHHGRPLVLKSPAHTGRVPVLLERFPDARFVHIHRDPYTVFQSTRHLYDTVDWFWTLQRRSGDIDEVILRQYRLLHEAWFADRDRIGAGRLHELAYTDLVADPLGEMQRLYEALDLGDFAVAEPHVRAYLSALGPYTPNVLPPLTEAERKRVAEVAAPCFDAWGYPR